MVSCQRTEEEGDDEDEDDVKEEDNGDAVAGLQKVNPVFVHLIPFTRCGFAFLAGVIETMDGFFSIY